MDKTESNLIVVTGFGPFSGHEKANASWEAVRFLPNELVSASKKKYQIDKKLISVTYESVDKNVEDIWKKRPELVVHCGVHGRAKTIHLENAAYNSKFERPDCSNKMLPGSKVCLERNGKNCDTLKTKFDVTQISESVNRCELLRRCGREIIVSNDVGSFLCGYVYLKSLDIDCKRTIFVHVPCIDEPFTTKETSYLVFEIIKECIDQIESCKTDVVAGENL